MENIPAEIWIYIVAFFDSVHDVANFTTTCRLFHSMSSLFVVEAPIVIMNNNYDMILQKTRWNIRNLILDWDIDATPDNHFLSQVGNNSFLKTVQFMGDGDRTEITHDNIVSFFSSNNHSIQHVIISNSGTSAPSDTSLTKRSVQIITERCHGLQHVNFSGCSNLTDDAVALLSSCSNIQCVNFSRCYKLTDEAVKSISKNSNIQCVNFNGCYKLTDEAVVSLSECSKSFTNLRSVNFGNCCEMTNKAVKILSTCPNLQYINFKNSWNLTNESVEYISNCAKLQYVDFSFNDYTRMLFSTHLLPSTRISGNALNFLSKCPNLKSIIFSGCDLLTTIDSTSKYFNLQSVNFRGCCQFTNQTIKNIVLSCPNLRTVDFGHNDKLTDEMVGTISSCPKLRDVKFNHCDLLTNNAVKHVSRHFDLRSVDFSLCHQMTDEAIKYLLNCPDLQSIAFNKCDNLMNDAVIAIVSNCPRLQNVEFGGCHRLDDDVVRCVLNRLNIRHFKLWSYGFTERTEEFEKNPRCNNTFNNNSKRYIYK